VITKKSQLPDVEELVSVKESDRVHMPELSVDERSLSFKEVELGLEEQMAKDESERCYGVGLYATGRRGRKAL